MPHLKYLAFLSLFLLLLFITFNTRANDLTFDEIWKKSTLFKSNDGNYLNLSGRLQIDSAWFDSNQGEYNDISWRRFRFGFTGKYNNFTAALEADINLNNGKSDWYNRLTDANISYLLNDNLTLVFLKQSVGFTLDGRTSSKRLLTPERNNLTNNIWFTDEYFSGVSLKGEISPNLTFKAGAFSSDASDEIGFSEGSYFSLLSINKKFGKNSWWDSANINFDYVYNDVHQTGGTPMLSSIYNLSGAFSVNSWQIAHDISYAQGELEQSDLWGVVIMPSYQSSPSIQWVFRYTYLNSRDINGLKLGKYENKMVTDKGDKYQEYYAGMNWLLYQHKLKFQLGLQYTNMEDKANDGGEYQGWGMTLALRTYW